MRDRAVIEQFERRLVGLGCPAAPLQRKVRELADHHEDLKQAALEEGLSEAAAAARADELLGEPVALAERFAFALRTSSWWGRHRILGFCVLPPLAIIVISLLGLSLDALVGKLYFTDEQLSALGGEGPVLMFYQITVGGTYYAAIALTAALFCWLARRSASGLGWAMAACTVCSLNGFFFFVKVTPHVLALGYWPNLNWVCVIIPLFAAAVLYWRQRRMQSRFAPVPYGIGDLANNSAIRVHHVESEGPSLPRLSRGQWVTPTSVITALIVLGMAALIMLGREAYLENRAEEAELRTKTWPAERDSMIAEVKARQSASDTVRATTINLQPYVNAALADATSGPKNENDNNLSELPLGIHIFGGVPFDVRGKIATMGRGLLRFNRKYPSRVSGIRIARACKKLYLLHGETSSPDSNPGEKAARLVLHYANGSQSEVGIVEGGHLLNWRGPIYKTGLDERPGHTTAPGTELAWVGTNPALKKLKSTDLLRLYKSTFDNPRPALEVSTIDYVSTLTEAAPFLVGLTVE